MHDLLTAITGGDVLLRAEVVAALPKDHHAAGQQSADAVCLVAVAHR